MLDPSHTRDHSLETSSVTHRVSRHRKRDCEHELVYLYESPTPPYIHQPTTTSYQASPSFAYIINLRTYAPTRERTPTRSILTKTSRRKPRTRSWRPPTTTSCEAPTSFASKANLLVNTHMDLRKTTDNRETVVNIRGNESMAAGSRTQPASLTSSLTNAGTSKVTYLGLDRILETQSIQFDWPWKPEQRLE